MIRLLIASATLLSFAQASAAQSLARDNARVPAKGPNEEVTLPSVRPSVVGGPQRIVYRVSGLRDTDSTVTPDIASFVSCTSFSNVAEDIRIIAAGFAGTRLADVTVSVPARNLCHSPDTDVLSHQPQHRCDIAGVRYLAVDDDKHPVHGRDRQHGHIRR
jgi:hypothetical protein